MPPATHSGHGDRRLEGSRRRARWPFLTPVGGQVSFSSPRCVRSDGSGKLRTKDATQMGAVDGHHMIETFVADGSDQALAVWTLPWTHGAADDLRDPMPAIRLRKASL